MKEWQELTGRFCLYQRKDEQGRHVALPYLAHAGTHLNIIYYDMNATYRPADEQSEVKVDFDVPADALIPIDTTTERGRALANQLLTKLAGTIAPKGTLEIPGTPLLRRQ